MCNIKLAVENAKKTRARVIHVTTFFFVESERLSGWHEEQRARRVESKNKHLLRSLVSTTNDDGSL